MVVGELEIVYLENGEESCQFLRMESRGEGTGEGLPC